MDTMDDRPTSEPTRLGKDTVCPMCNTHVEESWDWCEVCGYDPDGLSPVPGKLSREQIERLADEVAVAHVSQRFLVEARKRLPAEEWDRLRERVEARTVEELRRADEDREAGLHGFHLRFGHHHRHHGSTSEVEHG